MSGTLRATILLQTLQALDSDANPDNGINIHPDMVALLEALEFDLRADAYDMDWVADKLTPFIRRGVAAGVLTRQTVPSPAQAIAHFLNAQGIEIAPLRLRQRTVDNNADGSVNEVESYHYDDVGNLIEMRRDANGDGVFTYVRTVDYDAYGQEVYSRTENTGGFSSVSEYRNTYDAAGRQIGSDIRLGGSGEWDNCITFSYDANDDYARYEIDTDCNGVVNHVDAYAYDSFGNRILTQHDRNGDGEWQEQLSYVYGLVDYPHALTEERRDRDGNGVWDWRSEIDYSTDGHKVEQRDYHGHGSEPHQILQYAYDTQGQLLTFTADYDGDGVRDAVIQYTYDALGNLTQEARDDSGNGVFDSVSTHVFAVPEQPRKRTFTGYDEDANGSLDYAYSYTWRADGLLLRRDYDGTGTGVINSVTEHTYDAAGNLLEEWHDTDNDGAANRRIWQTFNANGQVLSRSVDENGDGMANRVASYEYETGTALNMASTFGGER